MKRWKTPIAVALWLLLVAGLAWLDSSAQPPHAGQQHTAEYEGHSYDLEAVLSPLISFGNWILDWSHDDWLAFGTFIIAFFTAVLGGGTISLVRDGRRHSERQLRAYVHYAGCRWVSHNDTADGRLFWRIRPRWKNSGNTPTRDLMVYVHYELLDHPLPADYPFIEDAKNIPVPTTIPQQGEIESAFRNIYAEDMAKVFSGEKHLYIWGTASYRDVVSKGGRHITKFCVFAMNLSGDPLKRWHAETNPFDIVFATYSRHNCSDEDCEEGV